MTRGTGLLVLAVLAGAGCTTTPAEGDASAGPGAAPSWISWDDESGRLIVDIGPVDLPVGAGHDGITQPTPRTGVLPMSGWLRGYEIELIDAQGRPVPRRVLHHTNLMTPDRRELFSPMMQRIGAAGQETGDIRLPRMIGYRFEEGDSLLVTAMFHNPTDRSYEGVHLRIRMNVVPPTAWLRPLSVEPFYVDVTPPVGPHSFDLPPGRSERSWQGTPAVSGRILALAGHLHDHAVELRFENVTRDETVWTSEPIHDASGTVVGMPQSFFLWRLGLKLHAGETYRLTAIYDNPTSEVIADGGMGALGGILLPARSASWPSVDRTDPEYGEDMRRTLAGEHGMSSGHAGHAH